MSTLSTFPPPPPEGLATVCERNAELIAVNKSDLENNILIQNVTYPEVDVCTDSNKRSFLKESARSAFVEHEETTRKRLMRAWYEHGLSGVLEELSKDNTGHASEQWYSTMCYQVLGAVRWITSWHGALFPHLTMPSEDLIAEFSSNMNWKESRVRYIAWHPHTPKLAVALHDDSIKVYTTKKADIVPTLKHKLQKGVADLAWKPQSASVLAVGCQTCILLWKVDPNSLATRPSTSCVQVLSRPGHAPVTSLSWCPQGGVLVTASPTDTAIMVWDVAMEMCVPLRRVGGGGVCLVKWSPDGSKLLSTCPSSVFRVWETQHWTCEKWDKLSARCQTACWGPQGRVMLFSTLDQPVIYCLTFETQQDQSTRPVIGGSKVAITVCNLSEVSLETEEGPVRVGGVIQSLAWDPTGERLAASFKEPHAEYIALFQTRLDPVLELIPCGFISGLAGELPQQMCFQPLFSEGALLTVVWSSGRVAYIPLYFVSRSHLDPGKLYQHSSSNGGVIAGMLYSE